MVLTAKVQLFRINTCQTAIQKGGCIHTDYSYQIAIL